MTLASQKKECLRKVLREMGSTLVAFSGGVDSSLLLRVAKDEMEGKIEAVTIRSAFHPKWEIDEAIEWAKALDVPHRLMDCAPLEDDELKANRRDRCYRCKRMIMGRLVDLAREGEFNWVIEGTNASDRVENRAGMKALSELGVRSPLREAGLSKADIRLWAREMDMPHWDRPPRACLATRIPTGQRITKSKLDAIDRAEERLRALGFHQFRARYHGQAVRIEVGGDQIARLFDNDLRSRVIDDMVSIGFRNVWVDLKGYKSSEDATFA
jgi:uncharacterized protein